MIVNETIRESSTKVLDIEFVERVMLGSRDEDRKTVARRIAFAVFVRHVFRKLVVHFYVYFCADLSGSF